MPFVDQERRDAMNHGDIPRSPGDLCYLEYIEMVRKWKEEPRWRTADHILRMLLPDLTAAQIAKLLAFAVFFCLYVMPYEEMMRAKNGDI